MDDLKNRFFEFGTENPTLMEKKFWKYMISGHPERGPFHVANETGVRYGPSIYCFCRNGVAVAYLPDGRMVYTGGSHNDETFDDYVIYNDVIVIKNPKLIEGDTFYFIELPENYPLEKRPPFETATFLGSKNMDDITIYGYPEDVFPPNSFHTASHVCTADGKDYVYIIGGTKCEEGKMTPVYRLRISDFSIERVETSGDGPKCCVILCTSKRLSKNGRTVVQIPVTHQCKSPKEVFDYELDVDTHVWTVESIYPYVPPTYEEYKPPEPETDPMKINQGPTEEQKRIFREMHEAIARNTFF